MRTPAPVPVLRMHRLGATTINACNLLVSSALLAQERGRGDKCCVWKILGSSWTCHCLWAVNCAASERNSSTRIKYAIYKDLIYPQLIMSPTASTSQRTSDALIEVLRCHRIHPVVFQGQKIAPQIFSISRLRGGGRVPLHLCSVWNCRAATTRKCTVGDGCRIPLLQTAEMPTSHVMQRTEHALQKVVHDNRFPPTPLPFSSHLLVPLRNGGIALAVCT